jgi:hypothetical protein
MQSLKSNQTGFQNVCHRQLWHFASLDISCQNKDLQFM